MFRRLRALAGNLLLLLLSAAVACGAGEAALRLWRPQPLEAAYVWEDGTLRHLPGFHFTYTRAEFSASVRYNALGLRGPEVAPEKPAGATRVLFLGDSFVEGKQVADGEVITAVLEGLMRRGHDVEVVNAGVAGCGTAEELILWRRLGRGLSPDLVLLGFYPNDVRNNADRGLFRLEGDRAVEAREARGPRSRLLYDARKLLASRSHLYMLVALALRGVRSDAGRGRAEDAGAGAAAPLEAEEVFAREPGAKVRLGWDLTLALLDRLREEVEAGGARFAVVAFPTRFQVDDVLWAEHTRRAGLDPDRYDRRVPQQRLGAWSEETGAIVVDLLEGFRAHNVENSFYYRIDAHWNAEGHLLAAELTLGGLRLHGLAGADEAGGPPRGIP